MDENQVAKEFYESWRRAFVVQMIILASLPVVVTIGILIKIYVSEP